MRRDNASNYLDGSIAAADRLKGRWFGHMTLGLLGDSDAHRLSPSTDVEQNPSLRAAFGAFRLDHRKPYHWRLLAALLTEAYFVASRPRGGTKYWDSRKLCQLLADYAAVKKANRDVRADEKICQLLKKKFGKHYADQSAPTLRRVLHDARSPAKNLFLKRALRELKAHPETRGMTAKQARAYAIEKIAKRWTSD
jgi:hypothetical protein